MEAGIQIDESDEQFRNAQRSIHESLDLDSNVIVERERHPQKHKSPILSTQVANPFNLTPHDEETNPTLEPLDHPQGWPILPMHGINQGCSREDSGVSVTAIRFEPSGRPQVYR
jgi:hypothetical protein